MKQRKIAISLAVVGAIASPFEFSVLTEMEATSDVWVPLSADKRENITTYLEGTNNCQTFTKRLDELKRLEITPSVMDLSDEVVCRISLRKLKEGGTYESHFSLPKYLALNAGGCRYCFWRDLRLNILAPGARPPSTGGGSILLAVAQYVMRCLLVKHGTPTWARNIFSAKIPPAHGPPPHIENR
jgi:hypothetical protein